MKKTLLVLALLAVTGTAFAQSQIDTLYYDKNWNGVEISSFATYGIITMTPENPVYPKRFRCFNWLTKQLVSEGQFETIDPVDANKSVYAGELTHYYENGKIRQTGTMQNGRYNGLLENYYENGKLQRSVYMVNGVGNGEVKSYYENGQLEESGQLKDEKRDGLFHFFYEDGKPQGMVEFKEDEQDGKFVTYTEEGLIFYDGEMHGELFSGLVYNYDENHELASKCSFKENELDGPAVAYYPDGAISATQNYVNGLLDGAGRYYAQNGALRAEENYHNGILAGPCVLRDGLDIQRSSYKELIPSDGVFGVSAKVFSNDYEVEKDVKVYLEKKKQIAADTKRKVKTYHTMQFSLMILNNTERALPCSISDIRVEFINKEKPSNNMVITEESAVQLYQASGTKTARDAYSSARNTARWAATQQVNSSSGNFTGTSFYGTAGAVSGSNTVASAIGAALAGNNTGSRAGAVGTAGAASSTRSATSASTRGYVSSSSTGFSQSTQRDGTVEYQVYQQEKQRADQVYDDVKNFVETGASEVQCSSFNALPQDITRKTILASDISGKYDHIRLTCVINGQECSAEWSLEEME